MIYCSTSGVFHRTSTSRTDKTIECGHINRLKNTIFARVSFCPIEKPEGKVAKNRLLKEFWTFLIKTVRHE